MNITIIGAGNIGSYLAAYIALDEECKVCMHTSKPGDFSNEFILVEEEKNLEHRVKLHLITSSIEEATKDADLILITHPSFMFKNTIDEITKYIKKGAIVGAIPGFGGKEFYVDKLIEKGCIFFGSQRVPSITRLISYGKSVALKQKNPFMRLGVIPKEEANKVCEIMTKLIDIPCSPVNNYIGITLSPSNPTMHPSRLYELFNDYNEDVIYAENPLFYEQWGDKASSTLLALDDELSLIFKELNYKNQFDENDIEKIKIRYNIEKPHELTAKIRTAPGFKGIRSPMKEEKDGHTPDLSSRYFLEDLDYGLCILKSFSEILEIEVPTIDEVIYWAQNLLGREYVLNGRLSGKDVKDLVIPQNMGINTKVELINYYTNL